jgi:hypothetical protein
VSSILRSARIAASVLLLVCLGSCAGSLAPAFDSRLPDNEPARMTSLLQRLPSAQASRDQDATLIATTNGPQPELIAYDLARSAVRWRVRLAADSQPQLLSDLVLTTSRQQLLGFDAQTGRPRFAVGTGACTYLGAARDAKRVFFVCQYAELDLHAQPSAELTALDAHSGRVLWRRQAQGALGRPAAVSGLVLVPWQQQSLSLLDARNGRELARLRSRDDVIDWVRADERGVFFGKGTLYRLGAHGYAGHHAGASFTSVPSAALPGQPLSMESAFWPRPGSRSARGKIALYLEPEAVGADGVRIARGRYYFVFYRYVFGFDAAGTLLFARVLPSDAIAGQAVTAGLALALEAGAVWLLSPIDGATLMQANIGSPLASASLAASGLVSAQVAAQATPSLRRSLTEIALDADNRLVPARAYAVAQLAKLDDPEVTRDLLDIYAQSSTPPELGRTVADALLTRRVGLDHLIEALAARYDFLEQSRPAPLAVIVPPLVQAHEARALPRLVERMFDHETPLAVLPAVVRAVVALGDDSALAPLVSFLRLYRADSSFAAEPDALIEAARGILVHGGAEGPVLLRSIAGDGRASPTLARGVAALLNQRHGAQAPALVMADATETLAGPPLPERLSQEAINATFAEHVDDLRACLIDELGRNPKLAQVRIAFIAEADGSTHALSFAPNTAELQDCLYPKVAGYRFPRFRWGREVESYVIALHTRAAEPSAADATTGEERFWDWSAARPRSEDRASSKAASPWWHSQQSFAPQASPQDTREEAAPARAKEAAPSPTEQAAPPPASAPPPPEDAWWAPAAPAQR